MVLGGFVWVVVFLFGFWLFLDGVCKASGVCLADCLGLFEGKSKFLWVWLNFQKAPGDQKEQAQFDETNQWLWGGFPFRCSKSSVSGGSIDSLHLLQVSFPTF